MNFWNELKKPIFILAPMEDVTDTVFRQVIIRSGAPDVFFTEFTNVEGMFSTAEKLVNQRLTFLPIEKPIVAQIWGLDPKHFFQAGKKLSAMGFDGIDINMGCPQRSVVKKGACSALINNTSLAREIILATKEGAGNIPISVKTRIGFKSIQLEEWIGFLLSFDLPALTIHGRTAYEMSSVPAHWDEIGRVVSLKKEMKKSTLIIGNGDIGSLDEAALKTETFHVDGVMIGRGIFHNPWLFNKHVTTQQITPSERLTLLTYHLNLFEKTWAGTKPYQMLKKYFKIYISGFDGAGDIRTQLMETHNYEEARRVIAGVK